MSTVSNYATAIAETKPFRFFSLPVELRNEIYELHFWLNYNGSRSFPRYYGPPGEIDKLRLVCRQMRAEYTPICLSMSQIVLSHRFFRKANRAACYCRESARRRIFSEYDETRLMLCDVDEQFVRCIKTFELWVFKSHTITIKLVQSRQMTGERHEICGRSFVFRASPGPLSSVMCSVTQVLAAWLAEKLQGRQPAYLTKYEVEELAGFGDHMPGYNRLWDMINSVYVAAVTDFYTR